MFCACKKPKPGDYSNTDVSIHNFTTAAQKYWFNLLKATVHTSCQIADQLMWKETVNTELLLLSVNNSRTVTILNRARKKHFIYFDHPYMQKTYYNSITLKFMAKHFHAYLWKYHQNNCETNHVAPVITKMQQISG